METSAYADPAVGDETHTGLDDASRVGSIETHGPAGITSLSYGYDWANHKIWEDPTLNYDYAHTRRVETLPDDDGNRRTLTVAGIYSLTYDYTQRQQLSHINKINGANENPFFEYNYDRNGNLTKRQNVLQGHDSTLFGYDNANRVIVCVQTGRDAQTGQDDRSFSITDYNDYDLVNNVKSISRQEDQYREERFEYDYANQLKSVSYGVNVGQHTSEVPGQQGGNVEKDSNRDAVAAQVADPIREPLAAFVPEPDAPIIVRTVSYENDPIIRRSMNDNGTVTNYTPNKLNQYTAINGQATAYDGNFNLHGYDGWTYGYDADNRLISADADGHHAEFVYDGLGRCVRRTIDTATTVLTYDDWKPIVEWNAAGTFVAWNLYGPGADEILVRFQPDTNAGYIHYHLDAMGNVQFLLSEENLGLEKYTYDAFGRSTITSWTGDHRTISLYGNRFLFTGREYLYTLGIYDYRHRHYHPGLGRFLQTDSVGFKGDPMNLYRYCSGNPIFHSDAMGLKVDWNNKLIWNCFTSDGFGDWVDGSDGMSAQDRRDHHAMGVEQAAIAPTAERVTVEFVRHQTTRESVDEDRLANGGLASGETVPNFTTGVVPGTKIARADLTINVKYADGPKSTAGPKTMAHTIKHEPEHEPFFDRFARQAAAMVNGMNKNLHFETPEQAVRALEGNLRERYRQAYKDSHDLDDPRTLRNLRHDDNSHNSPYPYEK